MITRRRGRGDRVLRTCHPLRYSREDYAVRWWAWKLISLHERYGDAARVLQKGAAAFPDAKEFDVFLALTRFNMGERADAMRLLLNHIAEHSADLNTQKYRRAISYYAEHLDPPYDE